MRFAHPSTRSLVELVCPSCPSTGLRSALGVPVCASTPCSVCVYGPQHPNHPHLGLGLGSCDSPWLRSSTDVPERKDPVRGKDNAIVLRAVTLLLLRHCGRHHHVGLPLRHRHRRRADWLVPLRPPFPGRAKSDLSRGSQQLGNHTRGRIAMPPRRIACQALPDEVGPVERIVELIQGKHAGTYAQISLQRGVLRGGVEACRRNGDPVGVRFPPNAHGLFERVAPVAPAS